MRVIEEDTVLFTPGVLKSLEVLPSATSASYATSRARHQQFALFITQLGNGDGPLRDRYPSPTPAGTETMITRMSQIAQRIHAFVQRAANATSCSNGFRPDGCDFCSTAR